jgi:cytochrome c-type biogenesis protein CcmH
MLAFIGHPRWMLAALAVLLLHVSGVHATDAPTTAADPQLEQRVNRLSAELRCLVCQNQSLADSHADLAIDLKNQVREQLQAGLSEEDVIRYMTERYGDFVLYRPPLKATTALLWAGPLVVLLVGGFTMWRSLGRSGRPDDAAPLAADDALRLQALLEPEPLPRTADSPDVQGDAARRARQDKKVDGRPRTG